MGGLITNAKDVVKVDELTIITNNVPRDIVYGYELSHDERKEFDYLHWREEQDDGYYHQFFRYKGEVYDLDDFQGTREWVGYNAPDFKGWHGYQSDSFFSGILVRYPETEDHRELDWERVIVGRYYS